MYGVDTSPVKNLLAARCPWCSHKGRLIRIDNRQLRIEYFPDGREQYHFTDGEGCLVVLFLVAEGSGHAATAGGYDMYGGASWQAEQCGGLLHPDKSFLVAVLLHIDLAQCRSCLH